MNGENPISQMLLEDSNRLTESIKQDTKLPVGSVKKPRILRRLQLIAWRRNLLINAAAIVALVASCLIFWFTQPSADHRYILLLLLGLSGAYTFFLWHHDPDF